MKHNLLNLTGALCGTLLLAGPVMATEVEVGTLITASNLDSVIDNTFEGHRVGDLLTEKVAWMIREKGLTMTLKASQDWPANPRLVETTERYSGDVGYDPSTRMPTNYKAGTPFPDLDLNDPDAGMKLMWNAYFAHQGANHNGSEFTFLFIDQNRGLERRQQWAFDRYYVSSRLLPSAPIEEGANGVHYHQVLYARKPDDIRGVGLFNIRKLDGSVDNIWAYLKSVRRTRRLSGGAWMDPIGGTDLLNDEPYITSNFPTWYKKYTVLETKSLLMPAGTDVTWNRAGKTVSEEFPVMELDQAPYGNPKLPWMVRKVYVMEVIPPSEHPYQRKIWYMDTQLPLYHLAENYDKQGNLWKVQILPRFVNNFTDENGENFALDVTVDLLINYKQQHTTAVQFDLESWRHNVPGVTKEDFTTETLERVASGED